ncbi:DUF3180 domain-containing protein [Salinibacterium sp. NSLL150]|uniref:DUF3180 domain-containing protein n=1 Tax=unclassified Salinibacterium TaxID=2632331 RepID=UPI001009663D|nr:MULTISPECIES: DUF3180 domain-containing protein [unclassified Salinibacterium]MBH0098107.1 DUF3180 domain-containing protein [Salinibacterium sp. NSLL35]MBH0100862.1 DUF3180 domain-containing protein [Salinibacterium sp. NSLL150]MBH0103621.1 DUF3180 domain-containing protein [Salinibacterium sp. NSLL16]MBH0106382.1 DUF3180 domain-containing protein [Salinibacterium sp. NSLL17]MBH0109853.1 DUF3180 domain-containing protein [Salinibacterium sp. NG22]
MVARTSAVHLVTIAAAGAAVGWLLEVLLTASGNPIVTPSVALAVSLFLIAVIVVVLAVPIYRSSRGLRKERVNPFFALRVVVLAKASSFAGALLGGTALGIAVYLLSRTVSPETGAIGTSFVVSAGAIVLLIAGLVAEYLCTIPPDDDDPSSQNPMDPQGAA